MKPLFFLTLVLVAAAVLLLSRPSPAPAAAPRFAETAFDSSRGLGAGWTDLGWAPRELSPGKPVKLDLSDRAGWILSRRALTAGFGGLFIRYNAPPEFGDFLEVPPVLASRTIKPSGTQVRGTRSPIAVGHRENDRRQIGPTDI